MGFPRRTPAWELQRLCRGAGDGVWKLLLFSVPSPEAWGGTWAFTSGVKHSLLARVLLSYNELLFLDSNI